MELCVLAAVGAVARYSPSTPMALDLWNLHSFSATSTNSSGVYTNSDGAGKPMKTCIKESFLVPVFVAVVAVLVVCRSQAQFTYATNNGTITITGYLDINGVVVIPYTITGPPVTAIGDQAFANSNLTSVTIPNSVTSIGFQAFDSCTALRAITVETNNPAYSSLSGVLFDKAKTALIRYPADNGATSFAIPNRVTSIGLEAFELCISVTNFTIGNSVAIIGRDESAEALKMNFN